jgi:cytochrome c556
VRAARFVSLATLAWLLAIGFAVVPTAQAPASDEAFDKLMKSVGATVGAMRKNMEAQASDAVAADAKRMAELQKNNAAFWTARKTQDAAEWATAAMTHAAEVDKAAAAKNMAGAAEHMKLMMGSCAQCHAKYRDKGADGGYIIKKQ